MGGLVWADTGNLSVLPSSTPQAGWFLPRHSVPLHPNTVLVLTPFSHTTISTYNHQYYSYTSHFTSHLKMLWRDCLWDPKYRLVAGWRHVVCVAVERVRDDGGGPWLPSKFYASEVFQAPLPGPALFTLPPNSLTHFSPVITFVFSLRGSFNVLLYPSSLVRSTHKDCSAQFIRCFTTPRFYFLRRESFQLRLVISSTLTIAS